MTGVAPGKKEGYPSGHWRRLTQRHNVTGVKARNRDVYDDAAAVLRSALSDDPDGVAGAFDQAVNRAGVKAMYDVAVCLAATMVGSDTPSGAWTLDFPGIDEADYDERWVARFVSAYANADPQTGKALYGAAEADGYLPTCLLSLAGSAAATLRRRAR